MIEAVLILLALVTMACLLALPFLPWLRSRPGQTDNVTSLRRRKRARRDAGRDWYEPKEFRR